MAQTAAKEIRLVARVVTNQLSGLAYGQTNINKLKARKHQPIHLASRSGPSPQCGTQLYKLAAVAT